jgi:glutamine amidotransferase-like uncharacterized protein/effector-binding domain-containing protein
LIGLLFLSTLAFAESDVHLYIVPSRVEAVAPHTGALEGLSERFTHAVDWASRHGWHATAQGVAVIYSDPTAVPEHSLQSEARLPINIYGRLLPEPEPGEEQVHLEKSPAVLVLSAVHAGPYDTLTSTYTRLYRELPGLRLSATGPTREVYLNDPAFTPETELRTEVQIVVEPLGKADIALYASEGGYASGVTAASRAFSDAGLSIATVTAEEINAGRLKKKARALYMPGGWAEHYVMDIDDAGATALLDFVERGGGYIGVCAGSFYAAKEIDWGGTPYPYDLDLFPGVPKGPIVEIAPWPGYVTTGLTLEGTHPIVAGHPSQRTVLYYGGPTFQAREGAQVDVLARFDETGAPAMVAFERGKGRAFLSSVHLEYDLTSGADGTTWPELERHIADPESDWPLLQQAARWVLQEDE